MKMTFSFVTTLLTLALLANVSGLRLSRSVFPEYLTDKHDRGGRDTDSPRHYTCLTFLKIPGFSSEPCNATRCRNGGIMCHDSAMCICYKGTDGLCCSGVVDCRKDNFCGSDKRATCRYDTVKRKGVCFCSEFNVEFDDKEKLCRTPCEEDDDCVNGAKCTKRSLDSSLLNYYKFSDYKFCDCSPGIEGSFCSEITDCKKNDFCGTSNETTCTYDSTQMQAVCNCSDTSKKFDYKEKVCRVPCEDDSTCENGHKCAGDEDPKFCECIPGKEINLCSHVPDCDEPDSCGIRNDVTCEYDTVQLKARCQCSNSSKQFDYREKICREPCQDGDCENGGKCTGRRDFKFCQCLPGTMGDVCSEVMDCEEANFCGTSNDTTCAYNSTLMEALCQCSNSSKQFDYKEKLCRVPCGAEKCENGGVCNGTLDLKFCECSPGTFGDFCTEISICRDNLLCDYGSDVQCVYDKINQSVACECLNSNADFNYLTNKCECDCGHNGTCALDVFGEKDCSCNEGFAEFNGWCEGESKESTFPALIGSLFAFLVIVFSGLFYLRWRKQKPDTALQFKTLMKSMDEEYERSVHLK